MITCVAASARNLEETERKPSCAFGRLVYKSILPSPGC